MCEEGEARWLARSGAAGAGLAQEVLGAEEGEGGDGREVSAAAPLDGDEGEDEGEEAVTISRKELLKLRRAAARALAGGARAGAAKARAQPEEAVEPVERLAAPSTEDAAASAPAAAVEPNGTAPAEQ